MLRAAASSFAEATAQPAAANFVPQVAMQAVTLLALFVSDLLLLLPIPTVAQQLVPRRFS